jgi:hypothetical protein
MNNLFKIKPATSSFEEALNILQEANLGLSALDAVRFLARAGYKPGSLVNPLKHPFRAASLFTKTDKNDKRDYLGFIHADGTYLEASDGNTLIRLPSAVSPGWFTPGGLRLEYRGDDQMFNGPGWYIPSDDKAKKASLEGEEPHWPSFERVIPRNPGKTVYLGDFRTESLAAPHGTGHTLCAVLPEVSPGVDAVFDERLFDRMRRVGVTRAGLYTQGDRANMIVAEEKGMTVIILGAKP